MFCAICLYDCEIRIMMGLRCQHAICEACILEWKLNKGLWSSPKKCPECRASFVAADLARLVPEDGGIGETPQRAEETSVGTSQGAAEIAGDANSPIELVVLSDDDSMPGSSSLGVSRMLGDPINPQLSDVLEGIRSAVVELRTLLVAPQTPSRRHHCDQCNRSYVHRQSLYMHRRRMHAGQGRN